MGPFTKGRERQVDRNIASHGVFPHDVLRERERNRMGQLTNWSKLRRSFQVISGQIMKSISWHHECVSRTGVRISCSTLQFWINISFPASHTAIVRMMSRKQRGPNLATWRAERGGGGE